MMNITVKSYTLQPICEAEVLRYAGCKSLDEETSKLIQACITKTKNVFNPKYDRGEIDNEGKIRTRTEVEK